jgi:hypothetical protein
MFQIAFSINNRSDQNLAIWLGRQFEALDILIVNFEGIRAPVCSSPPNKTYDPGATPSNSNRPCGSTSTDRAPEVAVLRFAIEL